MQENPLKRVKCKVMPTRLHELIERRLALITDQVRHAYADSLKVLRMRFFSLLIIRTRHTFNDHQMHIPSFADPSALGDVVKEQGSCR